MKKATIILIAIAAALTASAQGGWRWANYWTGNDDPLNYGNWYNYVVRTAFDYDGNVYVYGCFGGNGRVYTQDTSDWFCDDVAVVLANTKGCALMKFDSLGNLLWKRTIKKSKQGDCRPYDMALHGDRILISGHYNLAYGNENLWFLDTLITNQTAYNLFLSGEIHPPYTYTDGNNTFFSILDLDGNVLENHFAKTLSRFDELVYPIPIYPQPINSGVGECKMCMDSHGNIYMATGITYGGPDTLPWTVVIDEDSAKTYDFYLPGHSDQPWISNMMLFKISPNFELLGAKLVVDHTIGVSPYLPVDSVNPCFSPYVLGLSIDEEDNLYLSGFLTDMFLMNEYNQYPMRFYWDSTHYATADDYGLEFYLPFIIKYDSDGNVQWSNQAYVRNTIASGSPNTIVWTDNITYDNSVYLAGWITRFDGSSALYYFDNENNGLDVSQYTTYFVRFNKYDGHFESAGVVPGDQTYLPLAKPVRPAVINNHLAFLTNKRMAPDRHKLLTFFNVDGTFSSMDTIFHGLSNCTMGQRVVFDNNGHILCDFACNQDLTFGHDFTLTFDDNTRSHAVIAYRYDPSILVPYPEDSTGVAGYGELNTSIRLYPNPATNTLFLEHENSPIERVLLIDMTGKEIFHHGLSSHRCEVDVSSIPDGIYFIKTFCEEGTYINKFVKTGH